ncbi:MAG: C39 family peptidase [Chloroflexota bacterium]
MNRRNFFPVVGLILLVAVIVTQIPWVNSRLGWRLEVAKTIVDSVVNPIGEMPTPVPSTAQVIFSTPSPTPAVTPDTELPTSVPEPTATPLPGQVKLTSPEWEVQDWNNCGPDTLSFYLQHYGWDGDQFDISAVLKPERPDRNVNVEELVYYVRNYAGWLNTMFRVGGDIEILEQLIAAGIPVLIEESARVEDGWARLDDDYWDGHYLLLTGYDQTSQTFTAQDSLRGADQVVTYEDTLARWQPFNYVYLIVYLPDQEETVKEILGANWENDKNREYARDLAQQQIEADSQDAFAWFNLGSNLVYFAQYEQAGAAYDQAREIGIPQRMLRYQFGPFFTYFNLQNSVTLLALADYAISITSNSEEAWLWKGWAHYQKGEREPAVEAFREAYWANIYSADAQYALEFMDATP